MCADVDWLGCHVVSMLIGSIVCGLELYGDRRYLHVLTHSFPTRLSSDLPMNITRSAGAGSVAGDASGACACAGAANAAAASLRVDNRRTITFMAAGDRKSTRLNSSH